MSHILLEFSSKWVRIVVVLIFSWEVNLLDKKKIDRINELAKKARSSDGLTPEEMTERAKLREEYLNAIRQNFKQTLDNIEIIDKGE